MPEKRTMRSNRNTRKNKPKQVNSELTILANFLNFDVLRESSEKLMGKDAAHTITLWHWPDDGDVETIQKEMRQELAAIIPPARTETPEEAYARIESLVSKINQMNLKSVWKLDSVEYEIAGYTDRDTGKFEIEMHKRSASDRREIYRVLGYGQRVLKLLGTQWVVSTKFSVHDIPSLRESLYGIVINALESGQLFRLRLCMNCHRFFVADDLKRKFCSSVCMKESDKKDAVIRVARLRRRQKKKKAKLESQQKAAALFANFSQFVKAVTGNGVTISRSNKAIVKKLGKGESLEGWKRVQAWEKSLLSGGNFKNLWSQLSQSEKQIFS